MCIDLQCPCTFSPKYWLEGKSRPGQTSKWKYNETRLEPTAKLKLISSSHDIDIDETSSIYPLTIDTPTTWYMRTQKN